MWDLIGMAGRMALVSGGVALLVRAGVRAVLWAKRRDRRFPRGRLVRGFRLWLPLSAGVGAGACSLLSLRPVFCLAAPAMLLGIAALGIAYHRQRTQREWETDSLLCLRTLLGLLEGGMALPAALALVADRLSGPGRQRLRRALRQFQRGEGSYPDTLARWRKSNALSRTAIAWQGVELALARGTSAVPLLRRSLPAVEAGLRLQAHIASLRAGAVAQGIFALLVPWILATVLQLIGPEGIPGWPTGLWLPALLWQGVGGGLLWRACRFS